MARDSQAALVALNRFGFGARGGASGDFINAASDPRGFVRSELSRPSGVLLEVPGLQSTPALAQAVFEYQEQVRLARETAAKADAPASGATPPQGVASKRTSRARDLALRTVGVPPRKVAHCHTQNKTRAPLPSMSHCRVVVRSHDPSTIVTFPPRFLWRENH